MTALELRCRAIAEVHVGQLNQRFGVLCLRLTPAEKQEAIAVLAGMLMDVAEGRTSLVPNAMQEAAAAAGREEVTEADALMFAARVQVAQGPRGVLPFSQANEIIKALPMEQQKLEGEG